ncbi:hypothetical protein JL720_11753 [Aureococcus anophagefferens]|nr:hypothetical protein JL720_11753 [Aureococcus anophagefferens]
MWLRMLPVVALGASLNISDIVTFSSRDFTTQTTATSAANETAAFLLNGGGGGGGAAGGGFGGGMGDGPPDGPGRGGGARRSDDILVFGMNFEIGESRACSRRVTGLHNGDANGKATAEATEAILLDHALTFSGLSPANVNKAGANVFIDKDGSMWFYLCAATAMDDAIVSLVESSGGVDGVSSADWKSLATRLGKVKVDSFGKRRYNTCRLRYVEHLDPTRITGSFSVTEMRVVYEDAAVDDAQRPPTPPPATPAPVETTPAPVETTPAPVETTPSTTTAPVETPAGGWTAAAVAAVFQGMDFCVTGNFYGLKQDAVEAFCEGFGGFKVTRVDRPGAVLIRGLKKGTTEPIKSNKGRHGAVSGKTDILIVGKEPGMSKVSKARAANVTLMTLHDLKLGIARWQPSARARAVRRAARRPGRWRVVGRRRPRVAGPAPALAYDLAKYNRKLDKLGLPPVAGIPDGFSPVLSSVNQDQSLIVQFNHPNAWLVVKPSVNTNGESGTVSAGDYGKGDSAALYVSDLPPGGDKAFYAKLIAKGLAEGRQPYELLTGAGFTVERRGVAAVSGVAGKSQALLAVTTSARYKKLEPELRKIVDSFRVYDKVRSVETGALLDDD